jgi:hypothetical protein
MERNPDFLDPFANVRNSHSAKSSENNQSKTTTVHAHKFQCRYEKTSHSILKTRHFIPPNVVQETCCQKARSEGSNFKDPDREEAGCRGARGRDCAGSDEGQEADLSKASRKG